MLEYMSAVRRGMRDIHGFAPIGGTDSNPSFSGIPDGVYPMEINGKIDHVELKDGLFNTGNFDEPSKEIDPVALPSEPALPSVIIMRLANTLGECPISEQHLHVMIPVIVEALQEISRAIDALEGIAKDHQKGISALRMRY